MLKAICRLALGVNNGLVYVDAACKCSAILPCGGALVGANVSHGISITS